MTQQTDAQRYQEALETASADTAEHTLHIMDGNGDTRVMWDPADPASVEIAKKAFDEAKDRKFLAYEVGAQGERTGTVIRTFNKDLGKVIMVPQMAGG